MVFKFALLLAGVTRSLAEASTPQQTSLLEGICQDSADADGSLEMLQKRMEKAQPSALESSALDAAAAGSVALADNASNASASLLSANASVGDLPFGIGNIGNVVDKVKKALPDGLSDAVGNVVTGALSGAAVDAFVALLNSTLQMLQVQADGFLAHCNEFKDDLLGNVSAGSDQAIAALQGAVAANVGPVQQQWVKISDAIVEVLPPLSAALEAIGQEDIADVLVTVVGKASTVITEVLDNATSIIASVGNTTQEKKDEALVMLNATVEKGLAAVAKFETGLVGVLQGAVERLAHKLGLTVLAVSDVAEPTPTGTQGKLEKLQDSIEEWVKTLSDGLKAVLGGTMESTEKALTPAGKSGAAARTPMGLLLAAVCASSLL